MSKNEWSSQPENRDQDFGGQWGGGDAAETSIFPPQRGSGNAQNPFETPQQQFPPQPQVGYAQQAQPPQPQYAPVYQEPKRSSAPWIVLVILLLLAIIAGAVLLYMRAQNTNGTAATQEDPVTVVTTVPPAESSTTTEQKTSEKQRPAIPNLPSGVQAVSSGAKAGRQSGNFDNVWKSGPTSDAFAMAVAKDFSDQYRTSRNTSPTLNVYSPVTGETYQMNCSDNGQYVHCTGGNDANVYIA